MAVAARARMNADAFVPLEREDAQSDSDDLAASPVEEVAKESSESTLPSYLDSDVLDSDESSETAPTPNQTEEVPKKVENRGAHLRGRGRPKKVENRGAHLRGRPKKVVEVAKETDVSEEVPKPKKRGRPKKEESSESMLPSSLDSDMLSPDESSETAPTPNHSEEVPKKVENRGAHLRGHAGRPKKVEKRGAHLRGRPKKVVEEVAGEEGEDGGGGGGSDPIAPPRKRGRPRKNVGASSTPEET